MEPLLCDNGALAAQQRRLGCGKGKKRVIFLQMKQKGSNFAGRNEKT
jgi:hypothetical protein